MDNHFSQAYKYVETENSSQLENYATEMLVFILKYLKHYDAFSETNEKIADLLGFCKDEYKDVSFKTQQYHTEFSQKIDDIKTLIPDISVYKNDNLHTIIEVKINQGLNIYKKSEENKDINQLEAYASIDGVQKVILLSKYNEVYVKDDNIKNILWSQIYEALEKEKADFVISNYLHFLDEHDMKKQIPLKELKMDILQYLGSFYSLLHNAWGQANIKEFYLSENTYAYKWGLGFYIKKTGDKDGSGESDFFLGINPYENVKNKISFWCKNCRGNEDTFEKVHNGFVTKKKLDLSELDFDDQVKKLSEWISENIKPILKDTFS